MSILRHPVLVRGVAVCVLASCAVAAGLLAGWALKASWNPLALASLPLLALPAVATGWLQFQSSYRGRLKHLGLLVLLNFLAAALLGTAGMVIANDLAEIRLPLRTEHHTTLIKGLLAASGVFALGFVVNGAVWRGSTSAGSEPKIAVDAGGPTRRALMPGVFLLFVLASASGAWAYLRTAPQSASSIPSWEVPQIAVPFTASDCNFYQGTRGKLWVDFVIDEATFRQWLHDRVAHVARERGDTRLKAVVALEPVGHPPPNVFGPALQRRSVFEGFRYRWAFLEQSIHACYDADENRGYYFEDLR